MDERLPERFRTKIVTSDEHPGCWIWTGPKTPANYGTYLLSRKVAVSDADRHRVAHRYAYECLVGPIPKGLVIDHLCRVTLCVNPAHLEPVTVRENTNRGAGTGNALWDGRPTRSMMAVAAMNSAKTHCPYGHPYDAENTRWEQRADGRWCRKCRECRNARMRVEPRPPKTHCKQGHEFTPENIYWRQLPSGNLGRACKLCTAANQRAYQARRRSRMA